MNPAIEKKLLDSLINRDYTLFKRTMSEALVHTKEKMIAESVANRKKQL